VDCDDGVACTDDSCDPGQGCVHTPNETLCDDGDDCSVDRCDVIEGCSNTPVADCGLSPTINTAATIGGCSLIR
jgi:hypothetical protein